MKKTLTLLAVLASGLLAGCSHYEDENNHDAKPAVECISDDCTTTEESYHKKEVHHDHS